MLSTNLFLCLRKSLLFAVFAFLLMPSCLFLLACNKSEDTTGQDEITLPGVPVKVMTYNIYGARADLGAPADLPKIAAVINKYKPDLVSLNEVDMNTNRTGKGVYQADSLAKLTGMYSFFVKAIDYAGGEYGDAVLSRFPLLETKAFNIGFVQEGSERRSVAMVKVKVQDKELYFASTHLDHKGNESNRLYQAEELRKIVAGVNGLLIIGGDFNAVPTSQTMTIIQEYLTAGTKSFSPTFPSTNPTTCIDYLLYKPAGDFYVQSYQVIQEPDVSDHCAVISIMRIK
jgi:endonuclease/exonuclease/phosphatase family metal-dependent hydrolase